jgi:excisionase family DNA binding protein
VTSLVELDGTPVVFFVQSGHHGPIKVGKTCFLRVRCMAMQDGSPEVLRLLGVVAFQHADNAFVLEQQLRGDHQPQHLRDGWFSPSPELLSFIDSHATVVEQPSTPTPASPSETNATAREHDIGPGGQRLLNAREVGRLLGIPARAVQRLARESKLPCVRIGERLIRFDADALEEYIRMPDFDQAVMAMRARRA